MSATLQKEIEKNSFIEGEYLSKLDLIKKDYDVLYNKYLKYKNMALVLKAKPNIPIWSIWYYCL